MTVKLILVEMVGHVSMESTHSLVFVWLDLLESIVKQVRIIIPRYKTDKHKDYSKYIIYIT